VTVVDNEPAMISIVSEIPYQQLTQTGQGGNIGTTAFREAGVKLAVTPRIADDGTILLKVEPEFSRLTGFTPEQNQPIIDRRTANTKVRANNGHTLVLGGLRQRTEVTENTGVPFFMNIPYVGWLFRSKKTDVRESELIVFIKPELVSPAELPNDRESAALEYEHAMLDAIPPGGSGGCASFKPLHPHDKDCPVDNGPVMEAAPMQPQTPWNEEVHPREAAPGQNGPQHTPAPPVDQAARLKRLPAAPAAVNPKQPTGVAQGARPAPPKPRAILRPLPPVQVEAVDVRRLPGVDDTVNVQALAYAPIASPRAPQQKPVGAPAAEKSEPSPVRRMSGQTEVKAAHRGPWIKNVFRF
jgi:general secretion pathway protein D